MAAPPYTSTPLSQPRKQKRALTPLGWMFDPEYVGGALDPEALAAAPGTPPLPFAPFKPPPVDPAGLHKNFDQYYQAAGGSSAADPPWANAPRISTLRGTRQGTAILPEGERPFEVGMSSGILDDLLGRRREAHRGGAMQDYTKLLGLDTQRNALEGSSYTQLASQALQNKGQLDVEEKRGEAGREVARYNRAQDKSKFVQDRLAMGDSAEQALNLAEATDQLVDARVGGRLGEDTGSREDRLKKAKELLAGRRQTPTQEEVDPILKAAAPGDKYNSTTVIDLLGGNQKMLDDPDSLQKVADQLQSGGAGSLDATIADLRTQFIRHGRELLGRKRSETFGPYTLQRNDVTRGTTNQYNPLINPDAYSITDKTGRLSHGHYAPGIGTGLPIGSYLQEVLSGHRDFVPNLSTTTDATYRTRAIAAALLLEKMEAARKR